LTRACLIAAAALALQVQPPVFRTGVEVVAVDVSVTRGNAPVTGLTAQDFKLTDEGVEQTIESVTLDRLPLSVTLVLDTSLSVSGNRLANLIQAGNGLLSELRGTDRASLITFSHVVERPVPMTGDFDVIRHALSTLTGSGSTSLRDAVQLAVELSPRDKSRPLILVFTDGADTTSWLNGPAVLDTARRADVVVHVVTLEEHPFLEQLTHETGGRVWSATSDRQLHDLFTRAIDEMRARYVLTFTPSGVKKPGWHELKVRLARARGDVTARPGYFVAERR